MLSRFQNIHRRALRVAPVWANGCGVLSLCCVFSLNGPFAARGHAADAPKQTTLLLDRAPFDRITLNAANQGTVLDVLPLDLSGRRVPQPLPTEGTLQLRRLEQPSLVYSVDWNSIARIELYDQLLLAESRQLIAAGKMTAAFDELSFLHKYDPNLPGLGAATDRYLHADALREFRTGRYGEALIALQALYDRNPKYPGLAGAVEAVGNRRIREYLAAKKYYAARKVLELLDQAYQGLNLPSVIVWKKKFRQASERQLNLAEAALNQKQYRAARAALRQATEILPHVPGVGPLLARLEREHPEIVVGVARLGPVVGLPRHGSAKPRAAPLRAVSQQDPSTPLADWAVMRVAPLVDPPLVEQIGFGAEGGIYRSPWASLAADESGLNFSIRLTPAALRLGVTADGLTRGLLALADPASPHYLEDYANRLQAISLVEGRTIDLRWKKIPVRPEALVRCSASWMPTLKKNLMVYRREEEHEPGVVRFQRKGAWEWLSPDHGKPSGGRVEMSGGGPVTIVERRFRKDDAAVQALVRGEVDLLDRVPPWQLEKLKAHDQVVVGRYRLPTLHVLLLSPRSRLLDQREFRRALCYGIDRDRLLRDILLAGQAGAGFRSVSGPFPAGESRHDPVGYAYNQQLAVRPYQPRLAAVLAQVARAAEVKVAQETQAETEPEKVRPLVLLYPPEPMARAVCQSIKIQLELVGIPIELRVLADGRPVVSAAQGATGKEGGPRDDYDLRYTELAMWEPVVDARRLLGPHGLANRCSASMGLALDRLDQTQNWKQVQANLHQVHKIAYYDLPVIPLWQTYNYFAHRKTLRGFGKTPVWLYQQVAQWHKKEHEPEP